MQNNDTELIQRTLEGDQQAFTMLVEKYQKQVHALAWQKIGDYHIAQEIAQDTFLTAYQKLHSLTHHNRFEGWLYVLTSNKCKNWHRKKRIVLESLEDTDPVELDQAYYSDYMNRQREEDADQKRRAFIQKLLSKLQESERTVMNLHYIGEMTCEDISKFLGVSINTVLSRLHRARKRLEKEEAMIKEYLSSFQLPKQMTENIMEQVSQLNPVSSSGSKPLVPLGLSAVAAICFLLLLIGVGSQHLLQFQKPYSLNANTESMVEIVDAKVLIDVNTKPVINRQTGKTVVREKNTNVVQNPPTSIFGAGKTDEDQAGEIKGQWSGIIGPEGGRVNTLYKTTRGDLYATTKNGLYRLSDDRSTWKLINSRINPSHPDLTSSRPWNSNLIIEHKNALYTANSTGVLSSIDRGETWNVVCERIKGELIGMVITDGFPEDQSDKTIYLAYKKGVYRYEKAGDSWTPLFEGVMERQILSITALNNTVFIGTDNGLYRLKKRIWEHLSIRENHLEENTLPIFNLVVTENRLYAARADNPRDPYPGSGFKVSRINKPRTGLIRSRGDRPAWSWSLFRSADKGNTWEAITPNRKNIEKNKTGSILSNIFPMGRKDRKKAEELPLTESIDTTLNFTISGEKLLLIDGLKQYYSNNSGKTWKLLEYEMDIRNWTRKVVITDNNFYRCGPNGIHRSIDEGNTWHLFNTGIVNRNIRELVVVNGTLYANTNTGLVNSNDKGDTWTSIDGDTGYITGIVESNGKLFGRDDKIGTPRLYELTQTDKTFQPIPNLPTIPKFDPHKGRMDQPPKMRRQLFRIPHGKGNYYASMLGSIIMTDTTYYVEYNHRLWRWKDGDSEWYDTNLLDTKDSTEVAWSTNNFFDRIGFKIAVSDDTVYVGKLDGHLMKSTDEGTSWIDVTENLPFAVDYFMSVIFNGNFVYVATNKGVAVSGNGTDWLTLTNEEGTSLIIERLVVDNSVIYGESNQKIYELNHNTGKWKQITSEIPYPVMCLDVEGDTIYVGTDGQGVIRYTIDNQ